MEKSTKQEQEQENDDTKFSSKDPAFVRFPPHTQAYKA